jgi:hypothetical protein
VQGAAAKIPEYELVIFAHRSEAIGAPIRAGIVEGDGGYEGGVALASCNDALFPGGEDRKKIVLATSLSKAV